MSKEDIKYLFEMIKLKFTQPKKDDGYLEWKELCRQKREIDLVEAAKMHKASFNDGCACSPQKFYYCLN
jgi:hypothetical protein